MDLTISEDLNHHIIIINTFRMTILYHLYNIMLISYIVDIPKFKY